MNLRFILTKLCAPTIGVLGMSLSLPYVTAKSMVPFLGKYTLEIHVIYEFLVSAFLKLFNMFVIL